MSENINFSFQFSDDMTLTLEVECPSCGTWQATPVIFAHTGEEFVCGCGESFPLRTEALVPVQKLVEDIKTFGNRTVSVAV